MSTLSWQEKASRRRAQQFERIPDSWRLPDGAPKTGDVRVWLEQSGLLTERELALTGVDDAAVVLDKLKSKEWSSVELCQAYCKRAALAGQLTNCLTEVLFERALARAKELDDHLLETGSLRGPLHGLVISLKEQFDIEGVECTMGFVSRIGHVSTQTAVLVQMLEDLGAVIICRTNVPQTLLCDETINHIFGRTLNPYNLELTAGGSSGGEAALLAMKGSLIGVGTDLGGSIRKPASWCGLYALRPTSRRLPYAGASNMFEGAEALESVVGPMGRSLSSIELFMKAVIDARPWLLDPKCGPIPWSPKAAETKKRCFGIMINDGDVRCHPPIDRAIATTRRALEAAGHHVIEWTPYRMKEGSEMVGKIFDADGGQDVRTWLAESGEPILPQVFRSNNPPMSVWESWQLNKQRDAFRRELMERMQSAGPNSSPLDAIIVATAPHVAERHLEEPRAPGLIAYTTVWSLLDLPCAVLPITIVSPDDIKDSSYEPINEADRLNWEQYSYQRYDNAPVGLQVVGCRRFAEDELLAITKAIEDAIKA